MARITVGMHEAKTHFSRLVRQAQDGEDIVVMNNGTAVARIVPYEDELARRPRGFAKGTVWMADDFDAPVADLEELIYGDGR